MITWYVSTQHRILNSERKVVDRLTKLDKLKDEILANTSHELRTPLFGMIGLAEGMIDNASQRLSKMDLNNLSMILASGRRLSGIVEDILDFSQIRNNTLSLYPRPIDLNSVVGIVISLTQPLIVHNRVKLVNHVSKALPKAFVDEERIQQIFHNLIGNAIKFTESGEINITAVEEDAKIVICVSDTGLGIPEDKIDTIFDAFTQIEDSNIRKHGGTGLGLSITKQLVLLHGGEIWLESTLGEGSKFYFSMPRYDKAVHDPLLSPPYSSLEEDESDSINISNRLVNKAQYSGVSSMNMEIPEDASDIDAQNPKRHEYRFVPKVLVVDDEAVNRRVLRNHLASNGVEVFEAENGHQAIEMINDKKNGIDLVVLDVMMPLMSGYDCCRKLREQYSNHELPIIFITAKFQLDDIIAGFDSGGNDFLSKPVSRQELLARTDLHLQLLDASRSLEEKIEERTRELKVAYKKLEEQSYSDPLTAVANRRFLSKFIESDISKSKREYTDETKGVSGKPKENADLVFLLVDIDYFKKINDQYGHDAGDKAIQAVAKILKQACRKSDFIVRWGGEEFLIVARFVSRKNIETLAERIRTLIETTQVQVGNDKFVDMTCSIGYAGLPLQVSLPNKHDWPTVIKVADHCLYAAKRSGRNTWVGIESIHAPMDENTDMIDQNFANIAQITTSLDSVDQVKWR